MIERSTRYLRVNKEEKIKLILEYMREIRVSFLDLLEQYLIVNLRENSTEQCTRQVVDVLYQLAVIGVLRSCLPQAAPIQDFNEELKRLVSQLGLDLQDINKLVDKFNLYTSYGILSEHAPKQKDFLEQLITS